MFKDEAGGKQIAEFVGLRAKLYSYTIHDGFQTSYYGRRNTNSGLWTYKLKKL